MLQRQLLLFQDLKKINKFVHISNTIAEYLFLYGKIITCMNACGIGHSKNPNHKNRRKGVSDLILRGWQTFHGMCQRLTFDSFK